VTSSSENGEKEQVFYLENARSRSTFFSPHDIPESLSLPTSLDFSANSSFVIRVASTDTQLSFSLSLLVSGSTTSDPTCPSSPSSTSGTSPSPSSNIHQHMSTPMGGPGSKTFLHHSINAVNRGLLTPPPSDGNKPTWSTATAAPGAGVQTRIPGTPMATPLAGKGAVGLGLGLGGSKEGLELPLGFGESSRLFVCPFPFHYPAGYRSMSY